MDKLLPLFRILPSVLVGYAILITFASVAEVRATTSHYTFDATFSSPERTLYLVALVRCFYDLFFLLGIAALVSAANRYLDRGELT